MAAIFTLSGIGEEKVRITVSERISGCPFIGSRFTWVTFWDESAARISSSLSGMGTPKMTPLKILEEIEVTGSVHETALPATSVRFRRISCCSLETGRAERSPPCITSESLTSPASSLRARWNASRSPKDMALKLGLLSVNLIITGGRCGSLDAGLPDPRAGKSAGRLVKALLWGGADSEIKDAIVHF